ncbi:hypothetical protein [Kitasatospora sp. NPDC093558]
MGVLLGTGNAAGVHRPVGVVAGTVSTPAPTPHATPEDDRWN